MRPVADARPSDLQKPVGRVHLGRQDSGGDVKQARDERTTVGAPWGGEDSSRRRLYRVDVNLPTKTSLGFARIVNLSGSGCVMILDQSDLPPIGTLFRIDLKLPTSPTVLLIRAQVVRRILTDLRRPRIGVEFRQNTPRQEDMIIRYVFARERELLKQGLINGHDASGRG